MSRPDRRLCRIVLASCAFALVIALASPAIADPECDYYADSEETWFWGYGTVCAGSGPGCTECYDPDTGASCTTPGMGYCSPDFRY